MKPTELAGMCAADGLWTFWTSDPNGIPPSSNFVCEHCGGTKLAHRKTAGYAVMSRSSWSESRAKAETAKWKDKLRKAKNEGKL